jgi:hypothetical protein
VTVLVFILGGLLGFRNMAGSSASGKSMGRVYAKDG